MSRKLSSWLPLALILILAAFLRFYRLDTLPLGVHNDEIMNGYVGRFILENGVDLYGNRWPLLYFDNFGDYPNVIPMYLSGVFTYLFGPTAFAVRFPIALAGVFLVAIIYFLAQKLFKSHPIALFSALTAAVLPWQVVFSRATAEGVTVTLVFIIGFLLILKKRYLWGSLFWFSTYFLYPGFRLLIPLAFLGLGKKVWKFTLIAFLLTALISQTTWGKGRYEQTSVWFHNNDIAGRSQRYTTGLGQNKVFLARLMHNHPLLTGREVARQYLTYFSPQFLLGNAGLPGRYSVPEHGPLYYSIFFLSLLGIYLSIKRPFPWSNYFFYLTLAAPIAAALTLDDAPNLHRSFLLGVMFIFWATVGFRHLLKKIKPLALVAILAILLETGYFWHYYVNFLDIHTLTHRYEQSRQLADWLIDNQAQYAKVYAPRDSQAPLHYLFYSGNFDEDLVGHFKTGLKIEAVDNITFYELACMSFDNAPPQNTAVISVKPCSYEQPTKKIIPIDLENGTPVYTVSIL